VNIVPLKAAEQVERFGGKAVQLAAALRAGLPVPDGFALAWDVVDAVAEQGRAALDAPSDVWPEPCAVRSSAVDEDSADASFAGAHLSVLGVCGDAAVIDAISAVRSSGLEAGAQAYRSHLGLAAGARVGVVVQALVDSDVAGVMFTRNPLTGAEERVIEASWGLGEIVVAGLVTPDRFVLSTSGDLLGQSVGEKDIAIRRTESGGTAEVDVAPELIDIPCLGAPELAALHDLALACDRVFGTTAHDIEFAFVDGAVHLLQRRPITHG
jgi:pyruvate,water dikinase